MLKNVKISIESLFFFNVISMLMLRITVSKKITEALENTIELN